MTYLEAVNRVLRGLREDQVADVTGDYPELIGQFVNEAKTDLENLGPWYPLRATVNKTLADTDNSSDLTAETNEHSYLLYEKNRPMAFVVTSGTERRLQVMAHSDLLALRALNPTAQNDIPYAVSFAKGTTGLVAHFWPANAGTNNVRFVIVTPQDELDDKDTQISVNPTPVWREALVRAMEERGEEFSGSLESRRQQARQALNDAVFSDFGADEFTMEAA
jgi:hypothetical protein